MSFTARPVPAVEPQPKPLRAGHQRPVDRVDGQPGLPGVARPGAPRVPDAGVDVRQVEQAPTDLAGAATFVPAAPPGNALSSSTAPAGVMVRQLDLGASCGLGVAQMVAAPGGDIGQPAPHLIPTGYAVGMSGAVRAGGSVTGSAPGERA